MINYKSIILFLFLFVNSQVFGIQKSNLVLGKVKLPKGFKIEIYANNVKGARSLALGKNGTVFVGTREEGKVYAINKRKEIITLARGLNMPNGVAFKNGALFVAEINRILRFDNIETRLKNSFSPVIINDTLPQDKNHGWRYIGFGPDGKLYISIGAPFNVCVSHDKRFATIMRMNMDGTGAEIFASGIRNSVGFDWNPETKELWFTDNGRDWLGDDLPPDELNRAPGKGMNFGFPYCYGNNVPDPDFSGFSSTEMDLGSHVAALGMRFYTGTMFPKEYHNQIFIAEHGSWNRTVPLGYRITLVYLKDNHAIKYETFADGWHDGEKAWGRPVAILVMPDGAILVSDDKASVIYRISYRKGIIG